MARMERKGRRGMMIEYGSSSMCGDESGDRDEMKWGT